MTMRPILRVGAGRRVSTACPLLMAGIAALGGAIVPPRAAVAQEKLAVATRNSGPDATSDAARLAALGLPAAAIEQCEDAELLWRAVRELVLTQRVSEAAQQRILRRVWIVDPEIAHGSPLESDRY